MYGGGAVVVNPPKPSDSSLKHKVGETVSFKGLATSSTASSHTTNITVKKGKITRVVKGANYPYLINGGTGWVNDSLITSGSSSSTSSSSTSYYKNILETVHHWILFLKILEYQVHTMVIGKRENL